MDSNTVDANKDLTLPIVVSVLCIYAGFWHTDAPEKTTFVEMIVITFLSVCALTLAERDGARVRRILGQAGIIGVSIILFLFLLGQRLSPTAHVGDIFFQMPWIDFLRIVAVSFAVATAEELAFRKYLLEFLFSKYPTIKSAVICIVIFVVLHGWAIVTPLVTSTLFTCLVVRYKSWLAVVAMHCMYDSIFYAERYIKLMKGVAHDVTQTAGMLKIVYFQSLGIMMLSVLSFLALLSVTKRVQARWGISHRESGS